MWHAHKIHILNITVIQQVVKVACKRGRFKQTSTEVDRYSAINTEKMAVR